MHKSMYTVSVWHTYANNGELVELIEKRLKNKKKRAQIIPPLNLTYPNVALTR